MNKLLLGFGILVFSAQLLAQSLILDWTKPELLENGEPIGTITRFNIYQTTNEGSAVVIEVDPTLSSYQISDIPEGAYAFQISTVIPNGDKELEGDKSPIVLVNILAPIEIVISKPAYPTLTVRVID